MRREDLSCGPSDAVSDVLALNRGPALLRTEIHAIDAVSDLEIGDGPKRPEAAVGRLVVLDDGSRYEVAVASRDVSALDALSVKHRVAG
jgi:hypothetical protein